MLRSRIQVQRRTSSTDAEGSPQEGWSALFSVFAAVRPFSAREFLMAAQAGVQISHEVIVRYQAALAGSTAHNLRFIEGARVLEVVSQPIDTEERHVELRFQCLELLQG